MQKVHFLKSLGLILGVSGFADFASFCCFESFGASGVNILVGIDLRPLEVTLALSLSAAEK